MNTKLNKIIAATVLMMAASTVHAGSAVDITADVQQRIQLQQAAKYFKLPGEMQRGSDNRLYIMYSFDQPNLGLFWHLSCLADRCRLNKQHVLYDGKTPPHLELNIYATCSANDCKDAE